MQRSASSVVVPFPFPLSRGTSCVASLFPLLTFPIWWHLHPNRRVGTSIPSSCRTTRERERERERERVEVRWTRRLKLRFLRTLSPSPARRPPRRLPRVGRLNARTLLGRDPRAAPRKGRHAMPVPSRLFMLAPLMRWWRCTGSRGSDRCGRGSVHNVWPLQLARTQLCHARLRRGRGLGRRPPVFLFNVLRL
jgi:hypothetical protein